ncbi:MAG: MASE3 domain-containing protein [Candidatus Verstraetearchaeota archaeon]|nr:MASE3 domain-containing protein [Candidatus Verstraetearchaeota archaeon]
MALITATRIYGYLLFHSLVELFSVVIAFSIFLIAWNSRDSMDNHFLLYLGIVYFFVGMIDLLHTLAYKGMGVFYSFDSNLPTQLWIAARYLESSGLLISSFFVKRRLNPVVAFLIYAAASSLMLLAIFMGAFPDCYVEGQGLTSFKIASEYVITLILCLSIARFYQQREALDRSILLLVYAAISLTAISELSFTLYTDVYGAFNMLGHLLKLISFYLICISIVQVGITTPHALLFRATKENEERLQQAVEQKRLELSKLQERLLEIERSATFGEVASSVIHDIRTPLQALLNLVFMLKESDAVKDEKLRSILDRINFQIAFLNGVTMELKSFARPMNPSIVPVDLNALIRERLTSIQIPGNIRLEANLPEAQKVLADPFYLQRILTNLFVNAIEAMPDGGTLEVSARREDGYVVVEVTDTGVGIPPENRSRIFTPMFTTKKEGTGLGLAISMRLLKSMGGTMDFTSEPGKGTTFYMRLPAAD